MKKILAIICIIAMVFSMAAFASAEENANSKETTLLADLEISAGWAQAAVEKSLADGDNVMELPRGATKASVYSYVATQTGTLYIAAVDFRYSASWTDGQYYDYNDYISEWTEQTSFTVNGEELEGGFYGSVEVVKGEVYTFSWSLLEGADFGFKATVNLSYTDDQIPVVGIDIALMPSHLPMSTVEIPAGGTQEYILSYNYYDFSGYVLTITGENAYIIFDRFSYETYDYETIRIDAVDGVVEYSMDAYGVNVITIGNDGTEPATFVLDYYAPEGGEKNPIIVENLEDIQVTANAGDSFMVYFQWTADELGAIVMDTSVVNISCYNVTQDEVGEFENNRTTYKIYVEPGDVLQIVISVYAEENLVYNFTYDFIGGYRLGTERNPIVVDMQEEGISVEMHNETIFYTWTPDENATVTLDFTFAQSWNDTIPVVYVDGEVFELSVFDHEGTAISAGAQLTVTAGKPIVLEVSTTASVYGTLLANVYVPEPESEVLIGDANGDGKIDYLDAMLVAQFYVGDITEEELNMTAADVNGDGEVDYLDAMMVAQYYVGDLDSFIP